MEENNWSIKKLKSWLIENENYFNFSVNETKCEKWEEWKEDRSTHIYPCVCPTREQHCVFIETYYKFDNTIQLHNEEGYFRELVELHNQAEDDIDKILKWVLEHKQVFDNLGFNPILEIAKSNSPYNTIKYELDKDEFQNILEFQKIYIHELYLRTFDK